METDARKIAIRYYGGSERKLHRDMAVLSRNPQAVIIYLPQLVVLAKPVDSRSPQHWEQLQNTPPTADAWYIHLLAGDLQLARLLARSQTPRPRICFRRGARNTRPHIIRWARFTAPQHSFDIKHRKNNTPWDS